MLAAGLRRAALLHHRRPSLSSSHPRAMSPAADPADAAAAAAAASGSPPPPEVWLRTARRGLDAPVSWEELCAVLREWREATAAGTPGAAAPLGRLGRSREATVAYRDHRARVLGEWRTMSDYAAVVMLGWADPVVVAAAVEREDEDEAAGGGADEEETGNGGGGGGGGAANDGHAATKTKTKKAAGPLRPPNELPEGGVTFTPNDFPYYFEPGALHELLWAPEPLSDAGIEAAVAARQRRLQEEGEEEPVVEDAVYWVNPIELKSVPALWHAHVVFLFRKGARRKERTMGETAAAA